MELVIFNCKRCGAELDKQVDELGVYVCKYCGFENKLDNTYEINYISTDAEQDLRILINKNKRKAKHLLYDMKLYESAYKVFLELYEYMPNDLWVLEGLMISFTRHFRRVLSKEEVIKFHEYLNKYKEVQTDIEILKDIDFKYKQYKNVIFWNKVSKIMVIVLCLFFLIMLLVCLFFNI